MRDQKEQNEKNAKQVEQKERRRALYSQTKRVQSDLTKRSEMLRMQKLLKQKEE